MTEASGKRVYLSQAERGNVPVPVALHHAVKVALSLGVSYYINFCHKVSSKRLTGENI